MEIKSKLEQLKDENRRMFAALSDIEGLRNKWGLPSEQLAQACQIASDAMDTLPEWDGPADQRAADLELADAAQYGTGF